VDRLDSPSERGGIEGSEQDDCTVAGLPCRVAYPGIVAAAIVVVAVGAAAIAVKAAAAAAAKKAAAATPGAAAPAGAAAVPIASPAAVISDEFPTMGPDGGAVVRAGAVESPTMEQTAVSMDDVSVLPDDDQGGHPDPWTGPSPDRDDGDADVFSAVGSDAE